MDLYNIHCPACDNEFACRDCFEIIRCPCCFTDFILDDDREKGKKKRKDAILDATDLASTDIESEYHYEEPDDSDLPRARFHLPILILFTALLVILALLVLLVIFLPLRSGISPIKYLQEIFSQLSGKA